MTKMRKLKQQAERRKRVEEEEGKRIEVGDRAKERRTLRMEATYSDDRKDDDTQLDDCDDTMDEDREDGAEDDKENEEKVGEDESTELSSQWAGGGAGGEIYGVCDDRKSVV